MSQKMDLTGKWPYPNILEYHTIQGQHKIHYHKTMAPITILAWECGCCKKMNEDIKQQGEQVCIYVFYVLYVLWATALCHEGEQHKI